MLRRVGVSMMYSCVNNKASVPVKTFLLVANRRPQLPEIPWSLLVRRHVLIDS